MIFEYKHGVRGWGFFHGFESRERSLTRRACYTRGHATAQRRTVHSKAQKMPQQGVNLQWYALTIRYFFPSIDPSRSPHPYPLLWATTWLFFLVGSQQTVSPGGTGKYPGHGRYQRDRQVGGLEQRPHARGGLLCGKCLHDRVYYLP